MKAADFDYDLPPELIAQQPLPERSASRMLVLHRSSGAIEHCVVTDLPGELACGDLLVLNDTRVLPARLFGTWVDTGGRLEVLLLEEKEPALWEAMLRSARARRAGRHLLLADGRARAAVEHDGGGGRVLIRFDSPGSVQGIIAEYGVPPVPPYIKRPENATDKVRMDRERYQTVYARVPGAVAAPTAGLHFTDELLDELARAGVAHTFLTLHVGPGTFRPVKVEEVEEHVMESERYSIGEPAAAAIRHAASSGGRVVAVGSTTVRALEAVAAEHGSIAAATGRTGLFIRPPYSFGVVDAMLTNFHLPRSTLLMMICAFAGAHDGSDSRRGIRIVMSAYREAVRERYRFYSYGDCMLII